jgi:hypothetical protein
MDYTHFAAMKEGVRHREPIELEIDGRKVPVDMRKLSVGETTQVLTTALELAKLKKSEDPKPGDPIYDRMKTLATLALALVDHDSPKEDPKPFFDSPQQIEASGLLSDDVIEFVLARWELWVDQNSMSKRAVTTLEMVKLIASCAGDDALPFLGLSPAMQWHFVRFMARTLLASQRTSSSSSSPSTTEALT